MTKYSSIRQKLIALAAFIIFAATIAFVVLSIFQVSVSGLQHFLRAKKNIKTSVIDKGMTLVINNGLALRGMAEDNAYSAIREIVASTVKNDTTMIYGIYMDKMRQEWVHATRENLNGMVSIKSVLSDSISLWASGLSGASFKGIDAGKESFPDFFEFAAPVLSAGNEKIGYIRYGISTLHARASLAIEKRRMIFDGLLFLSGFCLVALIVLFIGFRLAKRQTAAITKPIEELTNAANAIARGDYSHQINSVSDDEIGTLAKNFETMRGTVKEYTEQLENKVAQRTKQLEELQKQLVDKAHKAGMADIAAGTLHNIGNILNSVKTSVEAIGEAARQNPLDDFTRANNLLKEHIDKIESFVSDDPRGKKLLRYYLKIEEPMISCRNCINQNIVRVAEKVAVISDVVAAQQNYAGIGGLSEKINLPDIIDDALTMQSVSTRRHGITIIKDYQEIKPVVIQKTKLIHIVINLLKNAKEAMVGLTQERKSIVISVYEKNLAAYIRVKDSGCGIPADNLTKIFSHGFTTKKDGHGFGLHSCANYMKEMNGEMWAESEGEGKGSSFILKFPV